MCMYVYIYIYIYTHIYTYSAEGAASRYSKKAVGKALDKPPKVTLYHYLRG